MVHFIEKMEEIVQFEFQ